MLSFGDIQGATAGHPPGERQGSRPPRLCPEPLPPTPGQCPPCCGQVRCLCVPLRLLAPLSTWGAAGTHTSPCAMAVSAPEPLLGGPSQLIQAGTWDREADEATPSPTIISNDIISLHRNRPVYCPVDNLGEGFQNMPAKHVGDTPGAVTAWETGQAWCHGCAAHRTPCADRARAAQCSTGVVESVDLEDEAPEREPVPPGRNEEPPVLFQNCHRGCR